MKKWLLIFLLIPFLAQAQQDGFYNLSATQITLPGPNITYVGSFTPFTNPTGSAATAQTITVSGSALTGSVTATPQTGMEVSLTGSSFSSSVTLPNSGNNLTGQPVTVYLRTAAATGVGTGSGYLVLTTPGSGGVGTVTVNVPYSYTVNPDPSMTLSPTSITGMTSVAGTQGTASTYTLTWANWLGNNITVTPPSGFLASQDGTVYSNPLTVTPSGTSGTRTMYIALSSGNSAGSYSGNVSHASFLATTQNLSVSGTTTAATNTPDTIGFFFDTTTGPIAGMYEIRGDPSKRLISGSISGTTLTYTSVSTSTNNWSQGGSGACILIGDGCTTATIPTGATKAMYEGWYNWVVYQTTYPQFVVGGLKTDGTAYDIELSGSCLGSYNINTLGGYNVAGATLQTEQNLLNAVNGGVSNTSNKLTWSSVVPDGSGNLYIYFGPDSGNQAAFLNYLIIRKHGVL